MVSISPMGTLVLGCWLALGCTDSSRKDLDLDSKNLVQTNFLPPGVSGFEKDVSEKMELALKARGKAYQPRTRHLNPDGSAKYLNRLILETSPYLLQHSHAEDVKRCL
jgi:hypothetical protein